MFYLLVVLLTRNHPFFGDCINLGARYANWFSESNFSGLIPPAGVDSGNPPFFGWYLATCWKLFGRSLAVSHLAILPFLIGIVWGYYHLASQFFKGNWLWMSLPLLLLEPTLLAQATMISPDIPLTCFFIIALSGMTNRRNILQTVAMCGLPLLSTRGIMTLGVVFLAEAGYLWFDRNRKFSLKFCWKYLPAGLLAISWLAFHYVQTGWISYNQESMPWAASFQSAGLFGFIKNMTILGWRMLDFGRVALWITLGILAFWVFTKRLPIDQPYKQLIAVWLAPLIVFVPVLARYSGLLQHRYLIQVFVLTGILVLYGLSRCPFKKLAKAIYTLLIIALISGHFWVYPDKIAQGWDSSLAHVPYFKLRQEMIDFIQQNNIPPNQVITGTPNQFPLKETDLTDDLWHFTNSDDIPKEQRNSAPFVFYSNVFNDIPDSFYDELHTNWEVVKTLESGGIRVTLFRNRQLSMK